MAQTKVIESSCPEGYTEEEFVENLSDFLSDDELSDDEKEYAVKFRITLTVEEVKA